MLGVRLVRPNKAVSSVRRAIALANFASFYGERGVLRGTCAYFLNLFEQVLMSLKVVHQLSTLDDNFGNGRGFLGTAANASN